jgi:hypothetical protein
MMNQSPMISSRKHIDNNEHMEMIKFAYEQYMNGNLKIDINKHTTFKRAEVF